MPRLRVEKGREKILLLLHNTSVWDDAAFTRNTAMCLTMDKKANTNISRKARWPRTERNRVRFAWLSRDHRVRNYNEGLIA